MFQNVSPNFQKGRILKKEMLENLRDYPRNFFDIYFKEYSNGIITGAELTVNEKDITISKGIIKYKDKLYILEEEERLPYYVSNEEAVIKVEFLEKNLDGDFIINGTEIFIDQKTKIEENQIELGRFKLHEEAVLRSDYTDFYDFETEFNTLNIINSDYAGIKARTMSPILLKYFSKSLLKTKPQNTYDIVFAMQCINESYVDREGILEYIKVRLDLPNKEYSNLQIYKYLCQILREAEGGRSRGFESRMSRKTKIIVD